MKIQVQLLFHFALKWPIITVSNKSVVKLVICKFTSEIVWRQLSGLFVEAKTGQIHIKEFPLQFENTLSLDAALSMGR